MGIRLNSSFKHSIITIKSISILSSSVSLIFLWKLTLNPTIEGTAVAWTRQTNSTIDYVNNASVDTTCTAGTDIFGEFLVQTSTGGMVPAFVQSKVNLGVDVFGTSDVLILSITPTAGTNSTFRASIIYEEQ